MIKRILPILLVVMVVAISLPAWAGEVTYKLTVADPLCTIVGTYAVPGYGAICYGDVYNVSDSKVGHYYMTNQYLAPFTGLTGCQVFQTIHMVELETNPGTPPWYNFTLQGSYAKGTGIGLGAITNITWYTGSLTGAYYELEYNTAPGYYWTLTLHLL